jgi:hypothetical protein
MNIELQIILEAVQIIKENGSDENVIKEQCNIILKTTREIKEKYITK